MNWGRDPRKGPLGKVASRHREAGGHACVVGWTDGWMDDGWVDDGSVGRWMDGLERWVAG